MSSVKHARTSASIQEYQPWHVAAATSPAGVTGAAPVGKGVATSTATTITGGVTTAIVVGSNTNIVKGQKLYIYNATGPTSESFFVASVVGTTVTATVPFANSYTGTSYIGSNTGTLMGPIVVNNAGAATVTLTLYNGNPNVAGAVGLPTGANGYGSVFAVHTNPSIAGAYYYGLLLDYGLFYTLAVTTTVPDLTFQYDDAQQPLAL